jgi:hypothetical protein
MYHGYARESLGHEYAENVVNGPELRREDLESCRGIETKEESVKIEWLEHEKKLLTVEEQNHQIVEYTYRG